MEVWKKYFSPPPPSPLIFRYLIAHIYFSNFGDQYLHYNYYIHFPNHNRYLINKILVFFWGFFLFISTPVSGNDFDFKLSKLVSVCRYKKNPNNREIMVTTVVITRFYYTHFIGIHSIYLVLFAWS